jgi:hypothetical protein
LATSFTSAPVFSQSSENGEPFASQISSLIEMLNFGLEIATETFFANPHLTLFLGVH